MCVLTDAKGVLLELGGEVRRVGETVEVALQHVPAHLIVERVAELGWNLEERQGGESED